MERRSFLKGVFGGVTAAGVVVAASQAEIAAFASPLVKDAPIVLDVPSANPAIGAGEHLYNASGDLVAVVRSVSFHVDKIDVTSFGDTNSVYVHKGPPRFDIHAEGIGAVEWDVARNAPRFRGVPSRSW